MQNKKLLQLTMPHAEELYHQILEDEFLTSPIELYFSGLNCSGGCEYCYLKDNKQLYEVDEKLTTKENLLFNTEQILHFLSKNNYNQKLAFIGAEFFLTDFWEDIINLLIKYFGEKEYGLFVVISTNCTWIKNKDLTKRIKNKLEILKNTPIDFHLSFSIDGKFADNSRTPFSDEQYDELFVLAEKYQFGFHPMVHRSQLDNWKENFVWWFQKLKNKDINLIMNQVRDNDFEPDDYQKIVELYDFIIDYIISNSSSLEEVYDYIFRRKKKFKHNVFSMNLETAKHRLEKRKCACADRWCLRVADLKLFACHRLAYNKFAYGDINLEDIQKSKSNNLPVLINARSMDREHGIKCNSCFVNELCPHGCIAAQYEASGYMNKPIESVCLAQQITILTIISKFQSTGILDLILNDPQITEKTRNSYIKIIEYMISGKE